MTQRLGDIIPRVMQPRYSRNLPVYAMLLYGTTLGDIGLCTGKTQKARHCTGLLVVSSKVRSLLFFGFGRLGGFYSFV